MNERYINIEKELMNKMISNPNIGHEYIIKLVMLYPKDYILWLMMLNSYIFTGEFDKAGHISDNFIKNIKDFGESIDDTLSIYQYFYSIQLIRDKKYDDASNILLKLKNFISNNDNIYYISKENIFNLLILISYITGDELRGDILSKRLFEYYVGNISEL